MDFNNVNIYFGSLACLLNFCVLYEFNSQIIVDDKRLAVYISNFLNFPPNIISCALTSLSSFTLCTLIGIWLFWSEHIEKANVVTERRGPTKLHSNRRITEAIHAHMCLEENLFKPMGITVISKCYLQAIRAPISSGT